MKRRNVKIDGIKTVAEIKTGAPEIHILQEETGGVPDTPQLYATEREAEKEYIRLVNANLRTNCKTFNAAAKRLEQESEGGGDYYLRFWSIELPEHKTIIYLRKGK